MNLLSRLIYHVFIFAILVVFVGMPLSELSAKTKKVKVPNVELPVCTPSSSKPKIQIVSWEPRQKAKKILGSIMECVTTQWDILKLLPGPNVIGVEYPSEHERWGYIWMWAYELENPIGETLILMDKPGKRLRKGKNPVEFYITFNELDVVEKVEMVLVKKSKVRRY